jgi:hypothetical protein
MERLDRYFTKPEAEAKLGKRVRNRVSWAGVPAGTRGTVTWIAADDDIDRDSLFPTVAYRVAVAWELPTNPSRWPRPGQGLVSQA